MSVTPVTPAVIPSLASAASSATKSRLQPVLAAYGCAVTSGSVAVALLGLAAVILIG
jgi:hypothetical protein